MYNLYENIDRSKIELVLYDMYLLYCGGRPCCMHTINFNTRFDNVEEYKSVIEQEALRYDLHWRFDRVYCEEEDDDIYNLRVFVFPFHYQGVVIDYMINNLNHGSYMYEFMIGTLLGYPPYKMEEHLTKVIYEKMKMMSRQSMEEDEGGLMDNDIEKDDSL